MGVARVIGYREVEGRWMVGRLIGLAKGGSRVQEGISDDDDEGLG